MLKRRSIRITLFFNAALNCRAIGTVKHTGNETQPTMVLGCTHTWGLAARPACGLCAVVSLSSPSGVGGRASSGLALGRRRVTAARRARLPRAVVLLPGHPRVARRDGCRLVSLRDTRTPRAALRAALRRWACGGRSRRLPGQSAAAARRRRARLAACRQRAEGRWRKRSRC